MKKAFTLAEVLITLVIIGVVAAITLPTIMANYTEHEKKAKVKKAYSILANAMTRVKAFGGDMYFEVEDGDDDNMKYWFNDYMKNNLVTTRVCYNKSGCWTENGTRYMNNQLVPYNNQGIGIGSNIITAVLNDGMLVNLDAYAANDILNIFGVDTNGQEGLVIYIDINGTKKPNVVGKDTFITVFSSNGFVPAYKDKTKLEIELDCSKSGTGISCIHKYLQDKSY